MTRLLCPQLTLDNSGLVSSFDVSTLDVGTYRFTVTV
jgi:hypothetical protein